MINEKIRNKLSHLLRVLLFKDSSGPATGTRFSNPVSTPHAFFKMNACSYLIASVLPRSLMILVMATCFAAGASAVSQSTPAPKPVPSAPGATSRLEHAPEPAHQHSQAVPDQDTLTRLQIFLDENGFGPGKINGRWSNFMQGALRRYHSSQGQPPTDEIDGNTREQLQRISPLYVSYKMAPDALHWVGNVPSRPAGMAKLKQVVYRSKLDFIAERFHTDAEFLHRLNPGRNLSTLKPGTEVQVPNIQPFQIETVQPVPDLPPRPEFTQRRIKIDTKARFLDLVEGTRIVSSFPITPGSKTLPAPIGTWKIVKVTTMPIFRWDRAMLMHGRRSSEFYTIPPGPRNPVGIVWIGLNKKGIGIHGTDQPETIGRSSSHGCIRLANWDAIRLVNQVTTGMVVEIF
jgi:lipoprotein-anchoring transpeptidase ErfK/SrfK